MYSLAKRTIDRPTGETMFEYSCLLHAIILMEYSRNWYYLNKSYPQMSNIECWRQLYHKKLTAKRTQFHAKEFYSYQKGPPFSIKRKGPELHITATKRALNLDD